MKIETKLTGRDKKILVLLGMVVVAAVFLVLIILPLRTENEYMKQQLEQNEAQMMEMQSKVMMLPSVQTVNADDKARLELAQEELYPMLQARDVDQILTELSGKYGLNVRRLDINMPTEPANMTAYLHADGAQSNPDGVDAIYRAQISLEVVGSSGQLQEFLDDLAIQQSAIRIVNLTWDEDDYHQDPVTGEMIYREYMRLELAFYMCNKDMYVQ